jgi:DNA replication protein DnaC
MKLSYLKVLEIEKQNILKKCPECGPHQDTLNKCRRGCAAIYERYVDYSKANIPRELWNLEIRDFSLTVGDKVANEKRAEAVETIRLYMDHLKNAYEKGLGIVLYGGHGTGKSMLAACIIKKAIELKKTARMMDFNQITNIIRRSRFDKDDLDDLEKDLAVIDFFCIENFGVNQFLIKPSDISKDKDSEKDINKYTRGPDFITREISRLMDIRNRLSIPSIITTYYNIEEMKKAQDEEGRQIISAIFGSSTQTYIAGGDYRKEVLEKNWRKKLVKDE